MSISVESEIVPMVELTAREYAFYVREAEKVEVLRRRLAMKVSYITVDELRAILDMPKEAEDTEKPNEVE